MRVFPILLFLLIVSFKAPSIPSVTISIEKELADGIKDGRVLLLFHHDEKTEPRFAVSDDVNSAQVLGMDFEDYQAGNSLSFDLGVFGYPIENWNEMPAGEYWVQAFIVKHETFNRADGHVIKMPVDQWEGRQWARTPGNLFSIPQKISWDGESGIDIKIDQNIPPVVEPQDTEFIKHIKFKMIFWI
jgi:hypothetical protein